VNIKDPARRALLESRNVAMQSVPAEEGGPFVPIEEAAAMAKVTRSNVYHWMRTGEVRRKDWGSGRMSVYASLADLKRKVPVAFAEGGRPRAQPAPAQRPRKQKGGGTSPRKRRAA